MVGVKVIGSDPDFQPELAAAGSRLAVVKATNQALRVAPAFNMFSNKYPHVVFLEVDVHRSSGFPLYSLLFCCGFLFLEFS
uniref:Thioredoxin like 1 n=1 Tax=Xiphophorus couchianus TaxID=32473 RepID=A0A3B5LDQ3_9TELE